MAQLKLSNDPAKMHQLFGKKLYANRFSFISEICQNAVDSHRMAGQEDPVIVGLKEDGRGDYIFYVRDTGLSFEDHDDFVAKVCTLMASGKNAEKTNDESCAMGVHGIGSISVSAYASKWNYTIVKNNTMFNAVLQEIPGKGLDYQLGEYSHTDEDKYVLFEVGVPARDLTHFITGMLDKLCYFKDIQFEFCSSITRSYKDLLVMNTKFKLLQSDDFQISTLSKNKEMHICLDQYFYPINWDVLGITPIPNNIGLRFGLADGLEADLTRENLQMVDNYRDIVLAKIQKVATWFTEKYNSTIEDEYESVIECSKVYVPDKIVTIEDTWRYNINELLKHTQTPYKRIKYKGVSDEVLDKFAKLTGWGVNLFSVNNTIQAAGKKKRGWMATKNLLPVDKAINYLNDKGMPKKFTAYAKVNLVGAQIWSKNKIFLRKKDGYFSYDQMLNLMTNKAHMAQFYKGSGINLWREKIKQFQILEDAAAREYFTLLSEFKIPAGASVATKNRYNKAKVNIEDLTGEIGVKYAKPTHSFRACKFEEKIIQVKDLHKQPHLHIYGTEAERDKLEFLYEITRSTGNNITPCIITITQQKWIKKLKLHNFMEITDFLAGKHDEFRKLMTAYIIDFELEAKYKSTFAQKALIKAELSEQFGTDLETLEKYTSRYNQTCHMNMTGYMKTVIDLTHELKLYDLEMWGTFNKVKTDIDKFDFVDFFAGILNGQGEQTVKDRALIAMKDVARARKIRMNWKNYVLDKAE